MEDTSHRAVAVVGVGAIMPGALDAPAFWENVTKGVNGISEVDPKRWDPALYFDPDPKAPRKTYTRIGGWVRDFPWEPVKWRLPIPPLVEAAMDDGQKWAIAITRETLADYGWPNRPLDLDRTAVILGNAMGGEKHYQTSFHIATPEFEAELAATPHFAALPPDERARVFADLRRGIARRLPDVTEDTMPGELSNCIAGRVANLFNFHGANYVTDAACASALAAMSAAVDGLVAGHFDAVLTGGLDRNMGPTSFVKFCKIGALSATGSRPYADGADGFVMGEGAAFFLLKRLADAERDGDRVYAVIRGIGASSDGRGKGITAPNPVGQRFALRRGWEVAGLDPMTCSLIEGHGTSTKVGDVVEVEGLIEAFGAAGLPVHSIPLGSVKSNIGHLKAGAGAAGFLKLALSLSKRVVPPSLNFRTPNPNLDWSRSPFYVNTELREWETPACGVRRGGLSAFGFGGTNFHVVVEEHVPGSLTKGRRPAQVAVPATPGASSSARAKAPLRGALLVGAATEKELAERLQAAQREAREGRAPDPAPPREADLHASERVAIDFGSPKELAEKIEKALKALAGGKPAAWRPLRGQGIFRGNGPAPKVAFLFTGQGSQYVNMARTLRDLEPVVAGTFAQADRRMESILGRTISSYTFLDSKDAETLARAEDDLKQTSITQPAVLTTDLALGRLLGEYGIAPDMVMGHSLGEYGALVTAGVLPLEDALEAVAARGREMSRVSVADNGTLAAVFAPVSVIEKTLEGIEGYVVVANYNSNGQSVIGGSTASVAAALEAFKAAGVTTAYIPVSHAFHTKIVEPATVPFRTVLERLRIEGPKLPVVANVTGDFYPTDGDVRTKAIDLLSRQIASPVRFVTGLERLYDAGVRVFVEVGPKRAVQGFVEDVLGHRPDVHSLATNHPRLGDVVSFNQAICGFWAAGIGVAAPAEKPRPVELAPARPSTPATVPTPVVNLAPAAARTAAPAPAAQLTAGGSGDPVRDLGLLFAEFLEKGMKIHRGEGIPAPMPAAAAAAAEEPVVVTGASLGLPGRPRVFDDTNVAAILRGDQLISRLPERILEAQATKHIVRLVKSEHGESRFEEVTSTTDVIKLAGRGGALEIAEEFGVPDERVPSLDTATRLAIGAGLDALRDAGIPLVMRYKTTTKGTKLPERWALPEALQDDTGIIFASAFPGYDSFSERLRGYHVDHERRQRLAELEGIRGVLAAKGASPEALAEVDAKVASVRELLEKEPYVFDRRFLFRILSMGHSQLAELIGARGPNTQINSACASMGVATGIAEDWIRAGRCRRVLVVSADDATSDHMMEWIGAGFVASGAAALDEKVEDAALPFDRRRHGMVIGMGAAAFVVESAEAARERGITPITRLLSSACGNSAFHGTRLDVNHIAQVMETLVSSAERKWGIARHAIAPHTVFVSHETYTPARGGSASAEVFALRSAFGASADKIVMANTKGFTGHAMATGIEDVVGVKMLETGLVPPIPNFKEIDPELGPLNLSKGGRYDCDFALRLGAGFGSQISMTLMERVPPPDGRRHGPEELGFAYRIHDPARFGAWLSAISGYDAPATEVEKRTYRVRNAGAPPNPSRRLDTPAAPARTVAATTTAAPVAAAVSVPVSALAAPPAAPATVAVAAPAQDPVEARVLAIVAEKTGYAQEMLALDLDLEADLGIDTVKQAELFTAVREEWGIPRDDSRKLRDYPTLGRVIQFVRDNRPDLALAPAPVAVPAAAAPAVSAPVSPAVDPVLARVLAIVTEKTGYPAEMLDPELDLEADLGVDTVKQAELFTAVREEWGIPRDDSRKLRDYPTLARVVQFVRDSRPDLAAAVPAAVPVAPVAVPVTAPAAAPIAPAADPVLARVLAIVTEKTGYPAEMLDPELDLEADLGVDTVKQAELFTAVREEWGIPRDDNRKLRDYPTLARVVQFVRDNRPDLAAAAPAAVPVAPAAVPATAPAAAPIAPAADPVLARVLAIVTEKTGYPAEMLDPELDLEADLGVDTVKQAELFTAVREEWGIPRDDNRKLRDYPTLAHVVQFVRDNRPDLAIAAPAAAPVSPAAASSVAPASAAAATAPGGFEAAARIPRRVVVPVLRPALPSCKRTGVDLGAGARVAVMFDRGGAAEALVERLRNRGVDVLTLETEATSDSLVERLSEWTAGGPVHGLFWLPALDAEGDLLSLDLPAFREALRVRVKNLYASARALYEALGAPGTFLVSATRLGGRHGYDPAGAVAPLGGAVSGFTKAFKREKAGATVKVVDFGPDAAPSVVADLLIEEALRDPGCVEVGYARGLRTSVGMRELPVEDGTPGIALGRESVFVVTGAAGSIVSAITTDLAAASGGTFHLLDLLPEPDRNDPDLGRLAADRDGLKHDVFERLKAKGERATPALVEKELARLERLAAALAAIRAVEAAGGTVHWYAGDLRDAARVSAIVSEIRGRSPRVDVLLHGAGLEISRFLRDKEPGEFDLVFDVKADGFFNLLKALGDMPLGATVAFSSVAGRFGNGGQTDYSSANDLLCKVSSSFRTTRPGTRGIALDWTAWGDIGMATRGSIPKMMELAGIDMLPAAAGIPIIRRELVTSSFAGEIVEGLRLGVLAKEWDETGGLDPAASPASPVAPAGPLAGRLAAFNLHGGLVVETELDPKVQPFLFDHRIDGTPVLPGVMGIEAFAQAAATLVPGFHVAAVEDVDFLAPFKFYRDEPRTVRVEAVLRPAGEAVEAECRLVGRRTLPGQPEPQETVHFRARVRLERGDARPETFAAALEGAGTAIGASDIYSVYFHGPAYKVLESSWKNGSGIVGLFADPLPPNHVPEGPTVMSPRLVELSFQTAGVFELGTSGRMGLPLHVDRVRAIRPPGTAGGRLFAVVTPSASGDGSCDAHVVDGDGNVYLVVDGYRTVELPGAASTAQLEPFRAAMA
jgi:acyl transferase domain-containing protein/acyl carrier protein